MRRVGVGAALVVLLGGASAATAESMTRSFGGVTATLHYEADDFPAANGAMVVEPPSLTVSRDGGPPQTFTASDLRFLGPYTMFNVRTSLVVQHLDGDGVPEVVFESFSYGPHCCFETRVASWSPRKNRFIITVQDWRDIAARRRHLNRDGLPEFVGRDTRFSYLFGAPFGGSTWPDRVWVFRRGTFVSVTHRYPEIGRRRLTSAWKEYASRRNSDVGGRSNALGTYLASASTAGPRFRRAAWKRAVSAERRHPAVLRNVKRELLRMGYAVN